MGLGLNTVVNNACCVLMLEVAESYNWDPEKDTLDNDLFLWLMNSCC